jgi:Domain of unknown function (DUF4136)
VRIFFACGMAVVFASLSGCAYVQTDVRVSGAPGQLEAGRTYRLAHTSPQAADPIHARYEARVREALAGYGFVEVSPDATTPAHYRVSIAYDTHPVAVGIREADCGSDGADLAAGKGADPVGCVPLEVRPVAGHGSYVHAFTVRFFDWAAGQEIYKVTTVERDDDKDATSATPYLVKSAFAKLPYAEHPDWHVKLHEAGAQGGPEVVSVAPFTK